jgi:hypothetical protein
MTQGAWTLFPQAGGFEGLGPFAEVPDAHHLPGAEGYDLVVELGIELDAAAFASPERSCSHCSAHEMIGPIDLGTHKGDV